MNKPTFKSLRPTTYKQLGTTVHKRLGMGPVKKLSVLSNPCHNPAGSPDGGQFCGTGGSEASVNGVKFRQHELSDEERSSIEEYTKALYGSEIGGYTTIQNYLRTGSTKNMGQDHQESVLKDYVKNIDGGLTKSSLDEDKTLLRGLSDYHRAFGLAKNEDVKIGHVFSDKGYVSTTISSKIAGDFSYNLPRSFSTIRAVINIEAKKGQAAYPINSKEKEIILPRNLNFQVTKITTRTQQGSKVKYINVKII